MWNRKRANTFLVICVMVVSAALAACASLGLGLTDDELSKLTPEQKVFFYSTQHKYARVLAITYKKQPPCGTEYLLACSDPTIVKAFQDADTEVAAAIKAARENPNEANLTFAYTAYMRLARLVERELTKSLLVP